MFIVDLRPYGLEESIELEGDLVEEYQCEDSDELIFLFDENHEFLPGIRQSLGNATRLIDAGIVDFVGAEGSSEMLIDVVRSMLFPEHRHNTMNVIMRMSQQSEAVLLGQADAFAPFIYFLRPQTMIHGIEDAQSHREASEALQAAKSDPMASTIELMDDLLRSKESMERIVEQTQTEEGKNEFLRQLLEKQGAASDKFIKDKVSGDRPKHFLDNYFKLKSNFQRGGIGILNAGKQEQDAVVDLLKGIQRASYLRIRPDNLPDNSRQAFIDQAMKNIPNQRDN